MHKIVVLLLFLISCSISYAQFSISGTVSNSDQEALAGATVLIKDTSNKIAGYCVTESDGTYKWVSKQKNIYSVTVSYLGYESTTFEIDFTQVTKTTKNITLTESANELKEVVVKTNRPVMSSSDTLTYDAKALETGNEYSVEELLQNIPGITIDEDGQIKYRGKSIEKVLVEGDDLLSSAYATLTKNMPIRPIAKIQILENYSRNKLLKGIENSEAVAINLTIDEKYKAIWFGNAEIGGGYKERYAIKFNLMNFSKTYKTFFNYNTNNLGIDGIGTIGQKQFARLDLETISRDEGSDMLMSASLGGLPIAKKRYNFNQNQKGTLSTIVPLGKTTKLRIRAFLGGEKASRSHYSNTTYDFEDTFFQNTERNNSTNRIQKQYISGLLTAEPSENSLLQSLTTLNTGKNNYHSNLNFNGTESNEKLTTESLYFDEQLTYTYKWNTRNVVLLKGRFLYDESPQTYHNDTYLMGDLFTYDNLTDVYNTTESELQYTGLQADVKLKQKNGDLFDFQVGIDHTSKNIATLFQLMSDGQLLTPTDYQFNGNSKLFDAYAQSAYNWDLKNFSINLSGNIHQLSNRYSSLEEQQTDSPLIINPNVSLSWKIGSESTLNTSYNYNNRTTDLLEMTNGYVFHPSRSFKKGLGAFNVYGAHGARINYSIKHYLNRHGLQMGISYQKNNKALSSRSALDQNSYVSEAILIDGGESINAHLEVFKIIKKLKGIITLKGNASKGTYFNYLNDSDLRKNTSYNYTYGVIWNSSFDGDFNFRFVSDWSSSRMESTSTTFTNTDTKTSLKLMYKYQHKLNIKADAQHYYFGSLQDNKHYFFMDLDSKYTINKDKYAVGLSVVNLFNTQSFTRYQINDYSSATDSYNLIPRYILASFEFKF